MAPRKTALVSILALTAASLSLGNGRAEVVYRGTVHVVPQGSPGGVPPVGELERKSAVVLSPTTATVAVVGAAVGAPVVFTATNTGNGPSGAPTVALAQISGGFVVTSDTCTGAVVAASANCTVSVARTAASDEASKGGSLTVSFASGGSATATFSGTATGMVPVASMSPASATASIAGTSSPGPATTFTVTNTGVGQSGAVTASFATATTDFAIQAGGTCGASSNLGTNQSCTVLVSRTGAADDAVLKTATLKATFAGGSSATATVSGTISGILESTCSTALADGAICAMDGRTLVKISSTQFGDVCDVGQTRSGSGCTGPSTTYAYNDGSGNYGGNVAATASSSGFPNTEALVASTSPVFNAARACRAFGAKWYLPAYGELPTLKPLSPAWTFNIYREYWSSTMYGPDIPVYAYRVKLNAVGTSGTGTNTFKSELYSVRCFWKP